MAILEHEISIFTFIYKKLCTQKNTIEKDIKYLFFSRDTNDSCTINGGVKAVLNRRLGRFLFTGNSKGAEQMQNDFCKFNSQQELSDFLNKVHDFFKKYDSFDLDDNEVIRKFVECNALDETPLRASSMFLNTTAQTVVSSQPDLKAS